MGNPLTDTDRAELCRRVDFVAMLEADGVDVKPSGNHFMARMRPDDKTPSCHVYPPGIGRQGGRGWTFYDYGINQGGDALAYVIDRHGVQFAEAVRYLAEKTDFWPDGWRPNHMDGKNKAPESRTMRPTPAARYTPIAEPETLSEAAQTLAAGTFLQCLRKICPRARFNASEYISARGCLPPGKHIPFAYLVPGCTCDALAADLAKDPNAKLMERAGLLKLENRKPPRLPWWGDVILFVCREQYFAGPLYIVARRMEWKPGDRYGKYINQPTAGGAVRHPFGLQSLYTDETEGWPIPTPDKAGTLLIVEGILDALGAMAMGWPALAMLSRPQAGDIDDRHGSAPRMLGPHIPALRRFQRVLVVPDADGGDKGATGEAKAAKLVGWLRAEGCAADLATVAELCPDAPARCKDLADAAKARNIVT